MIEIHIYGKAGAGKTSAAMYIAEALKGLGFKVYLNDPDAAELYLSLGGE